MSCLIPYPCFFFFLNYLSFIFHLGLTFPKNFFWIRTGFFFYVFWQSLTSALLLTVSSLCFHSWGHLLISVVLTWLDLVFLNHGNKSAIMHISCLLWVFRPVSLFHRASSFDCWLDHFWTFCCLSEAYFSFKPNKGLLTFIDIAEPNWDFQWTATKCKLGTCNPL